MELTGQLSIRVLGEVRGEKLSPDNYDIKEVLNVLNNIEDILYPNQKNRPLITYDIKEGSVRHIFTTAVQAVIASTAILQSVKEYNSASHLEQKTAKAIEALQSFAYQKKFSFEISSSELPEVLLEITPMTNFIKQENQFVETEIYVYGEITDAGGKTAPNFHIDSNEYGSLKIATSKDIIKEIEHNPVYKSFGVRVKAMQDIVTGDFDRNSLTFIDFVDYKSEFNQAYLDDCIKRATENWKDVQDTDEWLREMRGGYDA